MKTFGHSGNNAGDEVFGSEQMREPAPSEYIPQHKTPAEIAYQIVKDETFPQTQPRLNLATFVTTYMDDYGTRLMNESVAINYIKHIVRRTASASAFFVSLHPHDYIPTTQH